MILRIAFLLLLLALIASGVRWLLARLLRRWLTSSISAFSQTSRTPTTTPQETLVACTICHTFIPQSQAVQVQGCPQCPHHREEKHS